MGLAMAKGFKSGGRRPGTLNRVTRDVRALANEYTTEAVAVLVDLMRHAENEATRLAASRELLDRAVGKPVQHAELSEKLEPAPADFKAMSDDELWAILYASRTEDERAALSDSARARENRKASQPARNSNTKHERDQLPANGGAR